MITLMGSARETLPTFAYVKYSDWFLLTCLVFVFGALVEYAVVNFYDNSKLVKKRRSHPAVKHEINYTMNEDVELEMGQIKVCTNNITCPKKICYIASKHLLVRTGKIKNLIMRTTTVLSVRICELDY